MDGRCVSVCLECESLADGLQRGPGVRPADLQRRVVFEDVVAELLQRWLWIGCGVLSGFLHLLTDRNVDFLKRQKDSLNPKTPQRDQSWFPSHGKSSEARTVFFSRIWKRKI